MGGTSDGRPPCVQRRPYTLNRLLKIDAPVGPPKGRALAHGNDSHEPWRSPVTDGEDRGREVAVDRGQHISPHEIGAQLLP